MQPRAMVQSALFEDGDPTPLPSLPAPVRAQLQQQMVQWIREVALAIDAERRDEQDQR